jgi:hypothetical protein
MIDRPDIETGTTGAGCIVREMARARTKDPNCTGLDRVVS